MREFIPTNDLDSLIYEEFDSSDSSSDESDAKITSAFDRISNFGQFSSKPPKGNARSFASLLKKPQHGDKENGLSVLLKPVLGKSMVFAPRKLMIVPNAELLIGRESNIEKLHEKNVETFDCRVLSRRHAILSNDRNELFIRDLNSSNGTFLNGERIQGQKKVQVWNGDEIQLGQDVCDKTSSVSKCIIAKVEIDSIKKDTEILGNKELSELKDNLQALGSIDDSLENKLETLKSSLGQIQSQVKSNWKAMVNEDCLLSRIEKLEDNISRFGDKCKKNDSENLQIARDIAELDRNFAFLLRQMKVLFKLNIYQTCLISLILLALFFFMEIFVTKTREINVW